jgi:capsule biosynthesis phosphatase
MGYDRRVIVDFDDTIAYTTTRDWNNAEPIWPTINKMNLLYDKGWEVWILTARGQLSCNGDFAAADKKYRKIIEEWLHKHGVKYHQLSFEKRLASYYIDDKAMSPEDFVDLEISEIKTGWSGATVEKRGNRIFKTHGDSLDAAKWYSMAAPLVNVPRVYSMIGQTLNLEFLEDNGHRFKIDDVNDAIKKFSLYRTYVPYDTYIDKIKEHCKVNNDFWEIIPELEDISMADFYIKRSSFMHGDFSIENIIQTDKGMYLIDPIYKDNQWSSYLLDITKMLHSYRKYNRMFEYEIFLNGWINSKELNPYPTSESAKLVEKLLKLLEVTQWIRVVKYIPDADLKKEYHEKTKQLLTDLIKK